MMDCRQEREWHNCCAVEKNSNGEQKLLIVSNEDNTNTNINTIYTITTIVYVEIICNMKTKEYQD